MSENVTHVTGIAGLEVEEGRREALDNIKDTVAERRTGTDDAIATSTSTQSPLGGQPPASNSAKDASGGIPSGNGGLSSTAAINGPEDSLVSTAPVGSNNSNNESSAEDGIIAGVAVLAEKFKSVLGLGGAASGTETSETAGGVVSPAGATTSNTSGTSDEVSSQSGTSGGIGSQAYAYAAGAGTAITGAAIAARDYIAPADSSTRATSSPAASHDLADNNLNLQSNSSSSTTNPTSNTDSTTNTTTDDWTSASAKMSEPTNEKPAEPTTSNDGPAPGEPKEPVPSGRGAEDSDKVDGESKAVSDKAAAVRENPDAIPTAGGKKIGADHMGESKKIPELPPKTEEETSKEVHDNTLKNTGSATGGPGHEDVKHDGEKHGFMDKVKDAIHHKK